MEPEVEWVRMPEYASQGAIMSLIRFVLAATLWARRHAKNADIVVSDGAVTWSGIDFCIVPSFCTVHQKHENPVSHFFIRLFYRLVLTRASHLLVTSEDTYHTLLAQGYASENMSMLFECDSDLSFCLSQLLENANVSPDVVSG